MDAEIIVSYDELMEQVIHNFYRLSEELQRMARELLNRYKDPWELLFDINVLSSADKPIATFRKKSRKIRNVNTVEHYCYIPKFKRGLPYHRRIYIN